LVNRKTLKHLSEIASQPGGEALAAAGGQSDKSESKPASE
jgi:hypothetical protein